MSSEVPVLIECVVNVSEGRDASVVAALAEAAEPVLLDVHSDPDHNRSVLTLGGVSETVQEAARRLTEVAVSTIDLNTHRGVHPRIGAVDVVPFVPLAGATMADAVEARDAFARWAATRLGLPCFLYGPERSLPTVRREAFDGLMPDYGPDRPHPSAGAVAVGARGLLVAYNVWLAGVGLAQARSIARTVRGPGIRALGLEAGGTTMVSMNLVDPSRVGPDAAHDLVAEHATVLRAELVGLVPAEVLDAVPVERRAELDLDRDRTIEARLPSPGRWPR